MLRHKLNIAITFVLITSNISSCDFVADEHINFDLSSNTRNFISSVWISEKLDSTGLKYRYKFDSDGKFSCTSEIPLEGIAILMGDYKLFSDTLILNNDTAIMSYLGLDSIKLDYIQKDKIDFKLYKVKNIK